MIGGQATERRHVPALDGIRGFAALLVACYHFGRAEVPGAGARAIADVMQFGWAGVDLFFVLSGFLICGILLDTRDRPHFLRTFYKRRVLRIFPLYFGFLALFLFVIMPFLPGPKSDIYDRQKWLWTYLVNIDIARHGWFLGNGGHANDLWSLAIEEQFYLVAPFMVVVFAERKLMMLAFVGAIGALAGRFVLHHAGFRADAAYTLTFTRIDALCLGALLAIAARRGTALQRLAPAARVVLPLSIAAAVTIAILVGRFDFQDWPTLEFGLPALALGFAALLVLAVAPNGSPAVRGIFESRQLTFFGIYSYSLYIWHPLVGRALRLGGFDQALIHGMTGSSLVAMLVTLPVKLAAATLVAVISYRIIERPFLRLKDPPRRLAGVPAETSTAPA